MNVFFLPSKLITKKSFKKARSLPSQIVLLLADNLTYIYGNNTRTTNSFRGEKKIENHAINIEF